MSLRWRIFLILAVVVGLFAALDYTIQSMVMGPSFTNLEIDEAREDIQRCMNAIRREISFLDETFCSDWAAWDDTYRFVLDRNPDYIASNLVITTFVDNDIDLIYILNNDNDVMWGKIIDSDTEREITLPQFPRRRFPTDHPLLGHKNPEDYVAGVWITSRAPMLVSSRPILTSLGEGPIRGTMIMGRFLNQALAKKLSTQTGVDFRIQTIRGRSISLSKLQVVEQIKEGDRFPITYLNDELLSIATTMDDINGEAALLLQAHLPRDIYQKGLRGMRLSLTSILAVGSLLLVVILLVVDRAVLARLSTVAKTVNSISRTGDTTERIPNVGVDELGRLGRELNEMLETLDATKERMRSSEEQLKKSHEMLEVRVKERTAELESANERLRAEIVERERAEEALAANEAKLSGILYSISDTIVMLDPDMRVVWANAVAFDLFGENITSKDWRSIAQRYDCPGFLSIAERCFEDGRSHECESPCILPENRKMDFWCTATVCVRDEKGRPVRVIEVCRNITERKRLELEAMRSSRLASLGELAAGVAHEVNNPINGIINYAQVMIDSAEESGKETLLPSLLLKEAERIARIVKNLLVFGRESTGEITSISVKEVLEDTMSLMERLLQKDNIDVLWEVPDDLPMVQGNAQQLQQVFINLLSNARYALNKRFPGLDNDKKLEIVSEIVELERVRYLRTIVRDHGKGIPSEIVDKICDPFFTTKPSGEGTGVGLSISHSIVKDHGGRLGFRSIEGEYTEAIVDLPIQNDMGDDAHGA